MHIEISLKFWHFSFCTNLWNFSGDPYPVWWRLTQAYETLHLKQFHLFIAFWMGFPHVIILHYQLRRVDRYNIITQISLTFLPCISRQRTTKVLIRLCGCAGWSAHPSRLICPFVVRIWHKQVFSWCGSYCLYKAVAKLHRYAGFVHLCDQ